MLIAGDIGGTKTILAAYAHDSSPSKPIVQRQYVSAQYPNLETITNEFLNEVNLPIHYAYFAVAGPIINGTAKLTNLPWKLSEQGFQRPPGIFSIRLMNDLEAIANSIPHLLPQDIQTINTGKSQSNGAKAVIAPGTGLGQAYLAWDGHEYRAHASEGGHASFAPHNDQEVQLLQYLWKQMKHVSVESVCSGIGVPNIYDFVKESQQLKEKPEVVSNFEGIPRSERTRVIFDEALKADEPDAICSKTLVVFLNILGAETGNLALKQLATSGIYLSGGIAMHLRSVLGDGRFMQTFVEKGRMSEMLQQIPIHIMLTRAALLGVAGYGLKELYRHA
ncbi:glucokinase [Dictyobacter arantiisoli]|uniref:Glucokinase n=2 Tax=Dictyobacter arantiisoli TaxID=2014874 RepID=A0A5A5TFQ5_9CHLR|nr:glucokinase [Dictyobacter arantiisoli]